MPKVGLSLSSSFEKLLRVVPDPSKLCVFGCLCFPSLRTYSSYKLDPKSSSCVFLGYSLTQSAFFCFDPTLKKIFMSHHVKFVENVFLFSLPLTPESLVIDIDSVLLASTFTSGDLTAPSSSIDLSSTSPSPSPTSYILASPQSISPSSSNLPSNSQSPRPASR